MSSGRSHVDVNERRLRPIYDCLDTGNNKKAIQEADRILKKQRDLTCAKALKALAMIRLGRHEDSTPLLQDVHAQQPCDEPTLQAMAMSYRELYKLGLIADLYENAYKKKSDSEDILNALFMAYVRIGNYKKQQQIAMALHKLRPLKNPYYFWAVMSIVMQANENEKLGKAMFLPLAEKMVLKFINEGRLEAEAEVRIYLIILQSMAKYGEALSVLEGSLAEKLISEPDFPQFLEVEMLTKLGRWSSVNAGYRKLIEKNPDHWLCYKEYLSSAFILLDSKWSAEDGNANGTDLTVDNSIDRVVEFLSSMVKVDRDSREETVESPKFAYPIRGPYLAQLELIRLLKERDDDSWNKVLGSSALQLIGQYYDRFGDKPCCFADLRTYFGLLNVSEQQQMMADFSERLGTQNKDGQIVLASDTKVIQRHILLVQLSRFLGFHRTMSSKECLLLATELMQRYTDGLKFGEKLISTDQQFVDSYMLLVAHLLCDVAAQTENDQYIWYAIVLLEKSLIKSPTNFQLKLLAIQLYTRLGAFLPCLALYESLEIKHIQHDALGYIICSHVLRLGHLSSAHTIFDSILRFFATVHKDTSDYLISSYKYGSFPKVQEFVRLRHRLQNSLQFASSTVEKLLLELITNTSSHKMTIDVVSGLDIDPLIEQTDFDGLCDNRDCWVMTSWEPSDQCDRKELKEQTFSEEKAWLHVRNLTTRCLLAAVKLGGGVGGGGVGATGVGAVGVGGVGGVGVGGGSSTAGATPAVGNGTDAKAVELRDVLAQLRKELAECLTRSGQLIQSQTKAQTKDLFFGPYRTRLSPFTTMNLGERLLSAVDLLLLADQHQNDHQDVTELKESSTFELTTVSISDLVQQNNQPLVVAEEGSRKRFMVETLENLVLLTEHVSQVTLVLGACHEILKPLKVSLTKKGKKRKDANPGLQVSTFEKYDQLLTNIKSATTDLVAAFAEFVPAEDLVFQLDALRIDDVHPLLQYVDESFESDIRKKVMASYQTTICEMKMLLSQKQKYLESLRL